MQKTSIDWTDLSWNPVTGCSGPNGSPCSWCYAKRISGRFKRSFEPTFHPERLEQPLKLKKPSRIFACSMGDLFDPAITDEQIGRVFNVMMAEESPHTFQVLTKRPKRMRDFVTAHVQTGFAPRGNIWLGVSLTGNDDHDRAWQLLKTPAAVRFISYEPALGPLDLYEYELVCKTWRKGATIGKYLDWVIVGSQTGPGAVPPKREWIESIVEQCQAERTPIFMKRNLAPYWPGELIQQFPEATP